MSASHTFNAKYGPWALVTGAARGLGAEFSRQIAVLGINLVLVDVLAEEMEEVADEIRRRCDTEIRTIVADLSHPEFMEAIRDQTGGIEIGLLVSNAMFGPVGLFFDQSLEDNLTTVAVNVQAPLVLVQEFGAKMVSRKRGGIIMLSSASALQGTAYAANYAATKAYNLILAESLWDELREHGVDVLGFMPGATRTTGFLLSNPRLKGSRLANVMGPEPTVAEALKALGKWPSRIAGTRNRWTLFLAGRLMPRRKMITLVGKTMRDWYGSQ
ncbi:MAG: SDR family NAD(P)-dependent oxidoreductase [Dehalococcoidia bacterium]